LFFKKRDIGKDVPFIIRGDLLGMENKSFRTVLIKKKYFIEKSHFVKMLDPDEVDKQVNRNYLFIEVKFKNNRLLIPLRTNLGNPNRAFGVIGFAVHSKSKPLAGLDYRYILIVNDEKYLDFQEKLKIPRSQQNSIANNYDQIEDEAIKYVQDYIPCAIKNRAEREPKYRESSLQNFNNELGVIEGRILREKELELKKLKQKYRKDKEKKSENVIEEAAIESDVTSKILNK
jgi:hypothetical protein